MSQDFANKTSKVHEDATTILLLSFEEYRAPRCCNNVEVGSGAGTEGGWCEIDLRSLHIVESLVQSFKFIVFFFRARPEKFVAGGCKENTRPLTTTVA